MTTHTRVILVVDDNPADIYLAHEALEQNPRGIRVESAGNVEEALLFLKRRVARPLFSRSERVCIHAPLG